MAESIGPMWSESNQTLGRDRAASRWSAPGPGKRTRREEHALTFSANGTSRNSNNIRIEGATATNVWLPHVSAYVPGLEAIQEVSVSTGSLDADQGLTVGAAVNVQMKSGSNGIHGSIFEYHTNNAMKAKPFFLP